MEEFSETLDWALRLVCLIAVPASLALIVIAEPLLVTLFQNGNFTADDVVNAAGSLRAYAFGLLGFMAIKIFAPGFYARQDTRTPVRIGVIAMVTNMALNIVFFLNGMAHVGLALATSLAAFLNAGLLLRGLRREQVFRFHAGWGQFLLRMLLANAAMVAFLVLVAAGWQQWLSWTVPIQVSRLAVLVAGGIVVYGSCLFASGLRWSDIHR